MSSPSCCIEVAASPEQLCYIPCSFCNIVLAVSVPCSSLFDIVTVRCGHCTNLWSVNMGNMAAGFHQDSSSSSHRHDQDPNHNPSNSRVDLSSSSRYPPVKPPSPSIINDQLTINALTAATPGSTAAEQQRRQFCRRPVAAKEQQRRQLSSVPATHVAAPEKRTRVPSAYNQFIKQEIQRIKASNPNISHREAFSAAAKNWAHFPHIHFGLMLEGNNHEAKRDELSFMQGSKKRLKSTKDSINE